MEPVYLFVYGTLKMGRGNNVVLGDSKFMFNYVTEPIYTMVTMGGFPIVKRGGTTAITGEVYKVYNEQTLKRIFRLEGYTGIPNHPDNWYDVDTIDVGDPKFKDHTWANIFVMNADKYPNLKVIPNGIF